MESKYHKNTKGNVHIEHERLVKVEICGNSPYVYHRTHPMKVESKLVGLAYSVLLCSFFYFFFKK